MRLSLFNGLVSLLGFISSSLLYFLIINLYLVLYFIFNVCFHSYTLLSFLWSWLLCLFLYLSSYLFLYFYLYFYSVVLSLVLYFYLYLVFYFLIFIFPCLVCGRAFTSHLFYNPASTLFRLVFWKSLHLEVASDPFCLLINSSWLLVLSICLVCLLFTGFNLYCWYGIHFS